MQSHSALTCCQPLTSSPLPLPLFLKLVHECILVTIPRHFGTF
jgi:hypothetical protein